MTRAFPAGTSAGQRGGAASRLGFLRWSDGGDQVLDIAVGSSATALIAQFAKRDYTVPLIVLTNIPGIAPVAAMKTMHGPYRGPALRTMRHGFWNAHQPWIYGIWDVDGDVHHVVSQMKNFMLLHEIETSHESVRAIARGFASIHRIAWPRAEVPQFDLDRLALSHEVYTIRLADVVDGAGLDKVQHVGWRHYLCAPPESDGHRFVAADVKRSDADRVFTQLHRGWLPDATDSVLERVRRMRRVKAGEFKVRSFHIPALLIHALWLKDTKGKEDLLVPDRCKGTTVEGGTRLQAIGILQPDPTAGAEAVGL